MSAFESADVTVVAVSNDPVGDLAQFCDEHGITYEFLSDDGSRLIRQLGILNDLIEPEDPLHGIPFPGSYLLDERGVIVRKYFHREYQVREAPAFVLADGFGVEPRLEGYPRWNVEGSGATLEVVLGAQDLKFRQRAYLHLRFQGPDMSSAPVFTASGVGVVLGTPQPAEGESRVEVMVVERELTVAQVHVAVRYSPDGAHQAQELRVDLSIPVGELNRGRRT